MKTIRKLTVLILVLTMLVTGSGLSVFAESAEELTNNDAAATAESIDVPEDEAVQADTDDNNDENQPSGDNAVTADDAITADDVSGETPYSGDPGPANADEEKQVIRQTIEADVSGSDASVVLTGKMPEDAAVTAEPADAGVEGQKTVTAYNITIYADGEENKSDEWEPETEIKVSIGDESLAGIDNGTEVDVYHIPESSDGSQAEPEFVCKASVKNGKVTFDAESFSVYVIVQGPDAYTPEPTDVKNLNELASKAGDSDDTGNAFRLSILKNGAHYYFTDTLTQKGSNGYVIARTTSFTASADWYFEKAEDENHYYIFTLIDGERAYLKVKDNSYLDNFASAPESAASFSASLFGNTEGAFLFMQDGAANTAVNYSGSNNGFKCYKDNNIRSNNDCKIFLTESPAIPDDVYGMNNKTYGLLYYTSGINGYGMLSDKASGALASSKLLVRSDPLDQSRTLYIAKDASIAKWTFHSISGDKYALTADGGEYLRIDGSSLVLTADFDENCVFTVEPGTGSNKGKIKLTGAGSKGIAFNSNAFKVVAASSASWLNLADDSVYSDDDFVEYSASKVSVSDRESMPDGSQVIIYTRFWNETDKAYEFYAVDQDGNLIRVYESGDDIVWIGTQNNTLLWDFTEYYEPGTATPNDKYDLQNTYSSKYLAPQISGDRIFSDDPEGIHLNGRRDGDHYTTILLWDDRQYDFAGLKVYTQDGIKRIVSCPMSQAEEFYFAMMPSDDSGYTKVATVDHNTLGLTMKMVDFNGSIKNGGGENSPTTWEQYNVMGTQYYSEKKPQKGLLSSDLRGNYPVAAKTGKSLSELFAGAVPVNHLFIQSIYNGSGYYQFDSTENFAHLNGGQFDVYQELGTIPDGNKKTHTHGQFMPYNNLSSTKASYPDNARNLTDIYGNDLSDNYPRKNETLYRLQETPDSYFGMEVEGSFMQTPGGRDAWGHDIIFEFVGDDDFWLYVDGELVIDLGGIHSALGGSVNYSTGKVVVNKEETTLYDLFRQNYAGRNNLNINAKEVTDYVDGIFQEKTVNGKKCRVFKDYSSHDVRIFFMERGGGASNLRMRFNLATV
ncbi:MAG: hypothetical protein IJI87_03490, partial [Mogibacterium sp.]|nr:hypothetical protein [Mogibacterium sp.]